MDKPKRISKKKAIEKKLKRYFTGKSCKHGHIAERYTHDHYCVECHKIVKKAWKEKNKEILKVRYKPTIEKYRQEHKEEILAQQKVWYQKNRPIILEKKKLRDQLVENKEKMKKYYQDTREERLASGKAYMAAGGKEKRKVYYQKNKKIIIAQSNLWSTKRYREDPYFKIIKDLRRRIALLVSAGKMKKLTPSMTKFAKEAVGIEPAGLLKHIEKQFYPHPKTGKPMTWKNHSLKGWQIDHIKPVHKFDHTKLEEQKKCFHYTNLQPLWLIDHLEKTAKDIKK